MDHFGLLLSISELNGMLHETTSLRDFLDHCVGIVAQHFEAEVCSIYIYDPIQKRLNLGSTIGLNNKNVASVSLNLGEGLTGLALQELRPIMTDQSSKHPNYRYFPDLQEEQYDAYLGVPILRGIERIGVLVVQRSSSKPFDEVDQKSLRGVANQIAAMIDYTRLLIGKTNNRETSGKQQRVFPPIIKGLSASGGWAYGPVGIYGKSRNFGTLAPESFTDIKTLSDFNAALVTTIDQLSTYQKEIEDRLTDVASLIFMSHILLLQDEEFAGKIRNNIMHGMHPVRALVSVAEQHIAFFRDMDNPYFRQKADDIRDVTFQLLSNLAPQTSSHYSLQNSIIAAQELVPSDILILSAEKVAGVILIGGGITSHVAILARSLKLPMIIADVPALLDLPQDATALIDAETGNLFINPTTAIRAPYEQRKNRQKKTPAASGVTANPRTSDGAAVTILANVNLISDAADALAVHAKGIGLYRTEFPFMVRNTFPNEEEQYIVYRKLIEGMRGLPVTFRTLDIGGDKVLSYYTGFKEHNPFLGIRSIRFCLENPDIFKSQIRAILRAGHNTHLRIMFPMISSVDELEQAQATLAECIRDLGMEGSLFNSKPVVGIMIELPACLDIIDELAKRTDFFSIGTNDLIQYILAVDRTNEKVAKFYCSHHPSVLRAIKRISDAALGAGIDVSVCGDMAHESRYMEFLIGIGIRTISIDPLYFPSVCTSISTITVAKAEQQANRMLGCCSIKDVESVLSK
jgi:phosphotransferase system enzyme I (PtsP)